MLNKSFRLINIFKNNYFNSISKTGLTKESLVLVRQIRTISKNRLLDHIGSIEDIEIQEIINDALRIHLNL